MSQLFSDAPRSLDVVVMEVDMTAAGKTGCGSCSATLARVRAAADSLRPIFDQLGLELRVFELQVRDLTQARALGLQASPMIRIGAIDLRPEHQGHVADPSGYFETDRAWLWQGAAHDQPPTAMLLDGLLRAYARSVSPGSSTTADVPAYIRQFFEKPASPEPMGACGCG